MTILPLGFRWATPAEVASLPFGEMPPGFEGIWVNIGEEFALAVPE